MKDHTREHLRAILYKRKYERTMADVDYVLDSLQELLALADAEWRRQHGYENDS